MTVTKVGNLSVGGALPATATAKAAIDTLVSASLPEIASKVSGYTLVSVPSPSFDIGTQLATAATNLTTDLTAVAAIPGTGAAWAAAIAAGVAAMASLRAANPALGTRIDGSVSAIGGLNAQISAGVSGPNVNVPLVASIVAGLEAKKASIDAQASFAGTLGASLSVGGINVYRFDGNISTAGAELQARIQADGLAGEYHFVVLLPTTPSGWSAIQATVSV